MSEIVDDIIDELGSPSTVSLPLGKTTFVFSQPSNYRGLVAMNKEREAFVKDWMKAGERLPLHLREVVPLGLTSEECEILYLLVVRRIQPELTIPEAIRLLDAPKFCQLIQTWLDAGSTNANARALNSEVESEKKDSSEIPITSSAVSLDSCTSDDTPTT